MTRAFVAIKPPESVLDAVAARTSTFVLPDAKRTPREQWHITLQFLGNNADVDAVIAALAGIALEPEHIHLEGVGPVDGVRKRGTVFVVGVRPYEWLRDLAASVNERMAPLGHEPDGRRFMPHLTLARCRRRTDMSSAMDAVGQEPIGEPWRVSSVVVFESETKPAGAVHTARAEIPLGIS